MAILSCLTKSLICFSIVSAIPIAYLISLETSKPSYNVFYYHSSGFLRESAKWDSVNSRFLVSFIEGGIGEVRVPTDYSIDNIFEEVVVVKDNELAGNASLGIVIDHQRNRVLVAVAHLLGFGKGYTGLAAYDLSTWKRLFVAKLSGPGDEKSLADDVAIDKEGNAYVTDTIGNKIWKLDVNGNLLTTIRSPIFSKKGGGFVNFATLNGIVYHPDNFLLVIHTSTGHLFKVDTTKGNEVKLIEVNGGNLKSGDGLELLSPTKLVVAGQHNSGSLVTSSDGWRTATVVSTFKGMSHRASTAVTVKDGKAYINHLIGIGFPRKKHAIVEAHFSSSTTN